MTIKQIPAHIREMQRLRRRRIGAVREFLLAKGFATANDVASLLGASPSLANNYLNELRDSGEAEVAAKAFPTGAGRRANIWAPTRKTASAPKPWYRRILDWLTVDSDLEAAR